MNAMTIKMDAQYKELKSRTECNHCGGNHSTVDCNDDDTPMSHEEEAKFMKTFQRTYFYNDYHDHDSNRDNWRSSGRPDYNRDYYRPNANDKLDLKKQLSDFIKSQQSTNTFVKETFMDLKTKLETTTKNHQSSIQSLEAKFDRLADKHSARPSGFLLNNTQPNPRDEEPTPQSQTPKPSKEAATLKLYKPRISYPQRLQKEIIEAQYGKFLDMICVVQINVPLVDVLARMPNYGKFLKELVSNKHKLEKFSSAFVSDESLAIIQNKVPPKLGNPINFIILEMEEDSKVPLILGRPFLHTADVIIHVKQKQLNLGVGFEQEDFNALLDEGNYKIKKSLDEPPTDLELKPLPDHLEYAFLEENSLLLVIISS
ncbi:reverse transcriptase domain-containing protein [Tanacetum coccineum]